MPEYILVSCNNCGIIVERMFKSRNKKATCFDCKMQKHTARSKSQIARRREARKKS